MYTDQDVQEDRWRWDGHGWTGLQNLAYVTNKCQFNHMTLSWWPHHETVSVTLYHITSYHITSHRIASHHITSHHITSHQITSHHITSHHITLLYIKSHHITSRYVTSHHITSHHKSSRPFCCKKILMLLHCYNSVCSEKFILTLPNVYTLGNN